MKNAEYYRGREQTYLKHFFLEHYLERVAYVIGYHYPEFAYVDGFSGPWRSRDEAFEDTSFMIAIKRLRSVRNALRSRGSDVKIRCVFIESDPSAYGKLEQAVSAVTDIDIRLLNGEFEELIPRILKEVGESFSFVFIDPTGWTGFGLHKIGRILKHEPGEVLVNFMFDHINRFLDDPRSKTTKTFDGLFGGPGWRAAMNSANREEAILDLYRERMRKAGGFDFSTSTRILKPTVDRSYFYLVYGTRHIKGLMEFKGVEKKMFNEQERIRLDVKQLEKIERTGQGELFSSGTVSGPFRTQRATQQNKATTALRLLLRTKTRVEYEEALGLLLEMPLVWESDVKRIVLDMKGAGELTIEGLKPRERVPKRGCVLIASA